MKSKQFESFDLTQPASQTNFARLLGISQQAVSAQVGKGVLPTGGTYLDWLREYYSHLSSQAAGRGGDSQMDVARATIEEKVTKTALARLQYHEELKRLIDIEEARQLLADWASFANRQFSQAYERLVLDIESQHDIAVSPELREKHAGTATQRIRSYVEKLSRDRTTSSPDIPSAQALPD